MLTKPTHNPKLSLIKPGWKGNRVNTENQYVNLDAPSEKSFRDVFRWQTETNPLKHLKRGQKSPVHVHTDAAFITDEHDGFTWLGHACFLLRLGGKNLLTDPVFYNVGPVKRYTPLPCKVDQLQAVDYILLSHNHRDHCDKASMQQLCTLNPHAIILTGLCTAPLLRKWNIKNDIIEAGWYQDYGLPGEVSVSYLPARHWNRRGLYDLNEMLWGSFMIKTAAQTTYFGADSGPGVHFEEIAGLYPNIDHAFLGIGAYMPEWFMKAAHMGPADALRACRQLGAAWLVPMHHGTFDLSDEPIFYPLQEIRRLVEGKEPDNLITLSIGEKWLMI